MNINEIIARHKNWVDGLDGGERADLFDADLSGVDFSHSNLSGANFCCADLIHSDFSYADLSYADISHCNFRVANLRGADLNGADLDFSAFPLWCGGLDVHIDDRIATQLLYHLVRNVLYSKNTSPQLKKLLSKSDILEQANKFHRVDDCGEIVVKEKDE